MVLDFYYLFRYLESASFFSIVVPFLLVFAILFTLLEKTGIFGHKQGATGVNVLVALLLAFLAIINTRLVEFMNVYLGNFVIMIILFAVSLLLFMSILNIPSTGLKVAVMILAVFAVIWALVQAQYYGPYSDLTGFFNVITIFFLPFNETIFSVIVLALLITFIVLAYKKSNSNTLLKG